MFEIRSNSILAQILARENILVVTKMGAKTASFDLEKRILSLPPWDVSPDIYDMLIAHEVAHALETPQEKYLDAIKAKPEDEWKSFGDCMNVVEDARIDKLIQRQFPGIKLWYKKAQEELSSMGILDSSPEDPLLDRLNMYFKSNFLDLEQPFSPDEVHFIEKMGNLETIEDTIALANELYISRKSKNEEKSETESALDDFLHGSISKEDFHLVELNRKPANIIPFQKWIFQKTVSGRPREKYYARFSKQISYLCSEFLRRHKAKEEVKIRETTSGILNTNRLYQAGYSEDVFLQNQVLSQGKNHGFVMLVDMSSSMAETMPHVLSQLFILSYFCKHVQIPFEIYGFTEDDSHDIRRSDFGSYCLLELANNRCSKSEISKRFAIFSGVILASHGTPLSASLTSIPYILRDFRVRYSIEILHFILLTDGECNRTEVPSNTFIRDIETRTQLRTRDSFLKKNDFTAPLFDLVRNTTGAKITNFFLRKGMSKPFEVVQNVGGLDTLINVDTGKIFTRNGLRSDMQLMQKIVEIVE